MGGRAVAQDMDHIGDGTLGPSRRGRAEAGASILCELYTQMPPREIGRAAQRPSSRDAKFVSEVITRGGGQESLQRRAGVLRGPSVHPLGTAPPELGMQDGAPYEAGRRPPVRRAVPRGGPADVAPGRSPDGQADQPWRAVGVGRLWEVHRASAVLQRGRVPGLESIRQEPTPRDRLGLGPTPGEGSPRRVAVRPATDSGGHLGIVHQPLGAHQGQRGGRRWSMSPTAMAGVL